MSAGGGVPEAAGIRADLIGQHDGAVRQTAKLQLEVDQTDVELQQVLAQNLVDLEGVLADGVDLILRGQAQSQGMVVVDEGIMVVIVLIAELQGGALQGSAFLYAQALGEAAGLGKRRCFPFLLR